MDRRPSDGTAAPGAVPERFERECGFTAGEWRRCLPEAAAPSTLQWLDGPEGDGGAVAPIGSGRLVLHWRTLPERRIALMRMPRLAVSFAFEGCSGAERTTFLRRFDLVMQRGGG